MRFRFSRSQSWKTHMSVRALRCGWVSVGYRLGIGWVSVGYPSNHVSGYSWHVKNGVRYSSHDVSGYSSHDVSKTMSAGLAVVWQVSFHNRFCWIWSSSAVINTLKLSWMKRTCDVSKSLFTNRISSSWHQKSQISKRIVLIDNKS